MSAETLPPILVVVPDMIFSSRISAEARAQGRKVQFFRKLEALEVAVGQGGAAVLLVDLNCAAPDPLEVIKMVRASSPTCEIVAFFSHVQGELAVRAQEAGASKVMPRSRFVQQLPEVLRFAGRNEGPP